MACRSVELGEEARAKMEAELSSPQEEPMYFLGVHNHHSARAVGDVSIEHHPHLGRRPAPLPTLEFLRHVSGFRTVQVMKCDLSDLRSIRAFAKAFREKHGERLDVLVNNAGLIPGALDVDHCRRPRHNLRRELHWAFRLDGAAADHRGYPCPRVVCLSSALHHFGRTEWESSAGWHGDHSKWSAYSDSKLAAVLFVKELRRRFVASGSSATAFSVDPGAVRSDVWRFLPRLLMPTHNLFMKVLFLDVERGCRVSVCASAMPLASLSGSDYYQPYWLPFGCVLPFETMGPFVGCAPGRPSLPKDEPTVSREMWAACEWIVRAADAAREGTQTSPTS